MTATAPTFSVGKAWLVTISQILGSVGFGLGMYSAMTTLTLMITYFQTDYTTYGAITGVMGLLALITAIPGGLIMAKIGAARLCKVCLGLGALGAILSLGYLLIMGRNGSFIVFTLLGAPSMLGWGAMSVGGTMLISCWFPPKKRPLPMGCAGLFVPLSLFAVLMFSSPLIGLASPDGFTAEELAYCFGQSPYGFVIVRVAFGIYTIAIAIICLFTIRNPKPENSWLGYDAATEDKGGQQAGFDEGKSSDGFKNIAVWVVIAIWFCYSWGSGSYANYWPTYIESDPTMGGFAVAPATANMFSQAVTFSMIAVSLCIGFLLTKIKRDYWWILILIVTCAIAFNSIFLFNIPSAGWFVPLLVVYGLTQELWPMVTYTLVPELVDSPKALGAALGLVSTCMNAFGTIISAINGRIVDTQVMVPGGSWHAISVPLTICAICAVVLGIVFLFMWRKRWALLQKRAAEHAAAAAAEEAAA